MTVLIVTNILSLFFLGWLGLNYCKQRDRRNGRKTLGKNPIPHVPAGDIDPIFALSRAQAPSLDSQVMLVGSAGTLGGTSDTEAWILSGLAKSAKRIFELGTCTGKTTYLFALNSADDATVVTTTLPPDADPLVQQAGDDPEALIAARKESQVTEYYYEGTPVAGKITQLYGDSLNFDTAPYRQHFDLLFIDGAHAASYVKSDSKKAFEMVAPGGLIIWHDYAPQMPGVWDSLNELKAQGYDLKHIKSTTMVAYRAPAAPPTAT